ncbi:hypothetical protein, partial [Formosimonas limnophila]|uniref:hypothetical protein n=1 Tax=Formosimonas limnophila TaxID=1384487 RepID=UPI001675F9CE
PVLFNVYTNYAPFIEKAEVLVYAPEDVDRTKPAAVIPVKWDPKLTTVNVEWSGEWNQSIKLQENQVLSYNLRVYDKDGVWDETSYRTLRLLSLANREKEKDNLRGNVSLGTQQLANQEIGGNLENYVVETEQYGTNALLTQNIQVNGSRVRVRGNNIPEGYTLSINGNSVPVDTKRQFVVEYILPVGKHQLQVQTMKPGASEAMVSALDVDVTGKYFFLVGLADLTVSENKSSGNVTAISPSEKERFDSVQTDGRLAFYLKGKVQGKYLITAQADTREKEIDKLFSGFFKADAQDLFRRIDPDAYYPVYGDDSTTVRDVDTQGRLYVRLDWDKNQVLWGNFNTDLNDTTLSQYNRGLYGAKVQLRSKRTNELGEPSSQLQAFASEQQTAPGQSEFLGTGGSLYYLKNTDILPGSEQVSVLVRDKDSGRVLGETKLVSGRDYEMDDFQGRLILNRPLHQIIRDNNIILDNPNSGDQQTLVVSYEYFPESFDSGNLVAGVKGKQWFGDHFAAGGTYVEDRRSGSDYKLQGVDLTFQKGKGTYLKFENANSESYSAPIFYSDNGGLSFFEVPTSAQRKGEANSLEGSINFKELGVTSREAVVKGWYIEKDAGFSNSRIDNIGYDVKDWGVEGGAQISNDFKLTASYRDLKRDGLTDYERLKRSRVNGLWTYAPNQSISAEFQRVEENESGKIGEASLVGLRFNNRIGKNLDVYAGGQVAFDRTNYDKNDAFMVGGRYTFNNLSTVGVDYVNGDRGNALTASGEYRRTEKHTLYSSYTYSPDSTISNDLFGNRSYFKENGFTVGQRWQVSDKVRWTNESQWIKDSSQKGLVNNFGLEFAPRTGWNIGFNVQRGTLDSISTGQETKREAYSINAGFTDKVVDWNSKLEYRRDSGSESRDQWVTTNRVGYKLSEDWRFMGRLNYSRTTNEKTNQLEAQLIESGIGFAYRPLGGRWNALGKYTYLYDLGSPAQTGGANYDQRSQIFSVEGTYEANPRWEYAGKLAYRLSEARIGRGTGGWYSNNATFAALQARYHIGDRGDSGNIWSGWSAMAEYRMLDVKNDGIKSGFLVSLDKDVNKYMKVGLGYNFTDYSSDLTDLDY